MATLPTQVGACVGSGLAGAVRVALGVLWLREGITKYRAGFGGADIELVVGSTRSNPRVPGFFSFFTEHVLSPLHTVFGVLMPALETGLGLLLVLGVLTVPVAAASVGTLMTYWLADQLITQYPVMVALSAVVLLFPSAATAYSTTRLLVHHRRRRGAGGPDLAAPPPRWL
jgi:thiosulfate dehydrogenase [quinone] large subunit